jgi:hypothetical protein
MNRNDEPTSDMKNLHYDVKGNLQKGNKSRIEEINERLAYFPSELRDGGFSDNSLAFGAKLDIEYLLSKLEIAEKALEEIVRISSDNVESYVFGDAADDALQQIRE